MSSYKRKILQALSCGVILSGVVILGGCERPSGPAAVSAPGPDDWTRLPAIEQVEVSPSGLLAKGTTEPLGRVVLRQDQGQAYAVSADAQGRFSLPFRRPGQDAIFVVESQLGQDSISAGYALFVAAQSEAPVARIELGRATVRLDRRGGLEAFDSDGVVVIASGSAGQDGEIQMRVEDGPAMAITADKSGRWEQVISPAGAGPLSVTVQGRVHQYPGSGQSLAEGLYQEPGGWRLVWSTDRNTRQETWFPELSD